MTCSKCGSTVPANTSFCPRCGTQLAASSPAGPGPVQHAAAPAFRFDASRWSQADRIIGISTLLLFISLFLPWFSVSLGPYSASADSLTAHGYLYIVLILCLAIVGYLVTYAGLAEMPALPLSHRMRLLAATGLNALLILIGFLAKPGGSGVGWDFGAFIGLIAAAAAVFFSFRSESVRA